MTDWRKRFSFWRWLAVGTGGRPGWRNLWNRWLIVHLAVGFILTLLVKGRTAAIAGSVLLPLTAVLVALSIAWAGNALSLLQSKEIKMLTSAHPDGVIGYAYTYQLAVLVLLTAIAGWGLAALQVFGVLFHYVSVNHSMQPAFQVILKFLLFFWSSLAVREAWGVMQFTHHLLLSGQEIRETLDARAASSRKGAPVEEQDERTESAPQAAPHLPPS